MAPRAWRPALATALWVGVLRELECLLREPGSGRWIVKPPQRVEKLLLRRGRGPAWLGVFGVIPRAHAAGGIALAVGLAGDLHPQVGIEQRDAGVRGRPRAQPGARRVAPVARDQGRYDAGRLVVR